jgi:predicted RNA-binding Zn-ribbon protein involved in translation (DUF1610 family)
MEATPKKSWKEARTVRLLLLSATQLETAELCIRKWWLHWVRKLDTTKTTSQTFGTVLHDVNQRFLKTDNVGRDLKTGQPVELFPPGWTKARSRHVDPDTGAEGIEGEVTPAEADTIQRLVKEAIESGVLERLGNSEDRAIEVEFREGVVKLDCPKCGGTGWIKCEKCRMIGGNCGEHESDEYSCPLCKGDGKGDHIQVMGFIDYMLPDNIQDHKSTSNMRYAKSKEALRRNIQMMIYAHYLLGVYRAENKPLPDKITLRHNVYCKDPNDLRVRKTEVFVTPDEIDEFWLKIVEMAKRMSAIRRMANGWHDIEGPDNAAHACQAFGGCDFRSICGGMESEEKYQERIDKGKAIAHNISLANSTANSTANTPNSSTYKDQTMSQAPQLSLLQRITQKNNQANTAAAPAAATGPAAATAASPAPAPTAPTAPLPTQAPAPAQVTAAGPAGTVPWAIAGCVACGGTGFGTTGNPCMPCSIRTKNAGGATPDQYLMQPMGDGTIYWKHKTNGTEGLSPLKANACVPVVAETRVQEPAPAQTQTASGPAQVISSATGRVVGPMAAAAMAAVNQVNPTGPAPTLTPATTRTREKKGFTLCLNCVVSKGEKKTTRLVDVFGDVQAQLTAAAGKEYRDMDAFRRRDEVAKVAEKLAESFGSDFVTVDLANGTPDLKALAEAIRPFAMMEIVGTSM